jgi:curli biogenesis system outer membrane secretion channel CsgG
MIAGQITALELSKEGGALGGGFIPLLGLISKNTEKASMQLDLTSMNPQTLEINEARSFSANSDKSSWGFAAVGGGVGGGWSISKSLALDMVARDIIVSSANYLAETYAAGNITSRPAPTPAN